MAKQKSLVSHCRKVGKPTKIQHSPLCSNQLDPSIAIATFNSNLPNNFDSSSCTQLSIPLPKKLKFTIDSLLTKAVTNINCTALTKENVSYLSSNSMKPKQSTAKFGNLKVDIPENFVTIPTNQTSLYTKSKTSKNFEPKASDKAESHLESTSPLQQPPNWPPSGHPCSSTNIGQLECRLDAENRVLWRNFDKIGTEMIITKPGRRMFPTVKIRVENCSPEAMYYVYLDCIPVDGHRYRYVYTKSSWCSSGKAESTPPSRLYMHPDSPFSGAQLTTSPTISFEKAKLTNNLSTGEKDPLLILNSMHKYQPRVHILQRLKSETPLEHGGQNVVLQRHSGRYKSFQFKETIFMAVTAYQNQLVTKMKIKNNPFAKGFRESDKNDSNGINNRNGHFDGFENASSHSMSSPSHQSSYLQQLPSQLPPVNSLVTFAQIAPLASAAIQHLPPPLRPSLLPPTSWSVPWLKLGPEEKESFLLYYQLTSSLAMQLATCSSANLNKISTVVETVETKESDTKPRSFPAKRKSESPLENGLKEKRERLHQEDCNQPKAESSTFIGNKVGKIESNSDCELQEILPHELEEHN